MSGVEAFERMLREGGPLAVAWDRDVAYQPLEPPRLMDGRGRNLSRGLCYLLVIFTEASHTHDLFRRARWFETAEPLGGHWILECRKFGTADWYLMSHTGEAVSDE